MLKCKISYALGGQAALNDNGVRPCSRHGRKGSVEFLIRSAHHDWLNIDTCDAARTLSFIENYNPALNGSATGARSTDTRTWKDLNGNDIAEESELGPSTNLSFGLRNLSTPDPNLRRGFQTLYNIAIQHELHPGLAVSASYNRRGFHNLRWTDNTAASLSDYSIVNIADPRAQDVILESLDVEVAG